MFFKRKIGLVLAGGGGKGSYQLGVWKYLAEIGLTKKISVISGSSVGALNAVLLSLCDFDTAVDIWTTQLESNILDFKSQTRRSGAIFSREGLYRIMEQLDFGKLPGLKKKIYATCLNTDSKEAESFCLNNYDKETVEQLLCATSAIPLVFQGEKIFGHNYIDGGWGDEVPIKPLLEEGCTDAIVVNLKRSYHVDYSGIGINTVVIHPTVNLGDNWFGILDFSASGVQRRMKRGYDDCKNRFAPLLRSLHWYLGFSLNGIRAKKINAMPDAEILQRTLEVVSEHPELLKEIQGYFNIDFITAGGFVFWKDLAEYHGWRFQENELTKHIRLIDPTNFRRAWGKRRQLVDYCRSFLISRLAN